MKVVRYPVADGGDLLGWYAPPTAADGEVIVFFHGNAGSIGHRAFKARMFLDAGYGVFMPEYPGYGGNAGEAGEAGFYRAADAAIAWLADTHHYDDAHIIIYGESIGTGVATHVAVDRSFKAVVLEAPFSSAVDVARGIYVWAPVSWLMRDRFDSIGRIARLRSPLFILHGRKDGVVPFVLGEKLYAQAPLARDMLVVDDAGHSDLYAHGAFDALMTAFVKAGVRPHP